MNGMDENLRRPSMELVKALHARLEMEGRVPIWSQCARYLSDSS